MRIETTKSIIAKLRVSRQATRKWRLAGCPHERRGGRYFFDLAEVREWRSINVVQRSNPALAAARTRKLRARVNLISDAVRKVEKSILLPGTLELMVEVLQKPICWRLLQIADAAPALVNVSTPEAIARLTDTVYDALLECSQLHLLRDAVAAKIINIPDPDENNDAASLYAKMSEAELQAAKASLEARRLEITRDVAQGKVRSLPEIMSAWAMRATTAKTRLLSLPFQCGPLLFEVAPDEARGIVLAAIIDALRELTDDLWFTQAMLDEVLGEQTPIDMSPAHVNRPTRIRTRRASITEPVKGTQHPHARRSGGKSSRRARQSREPAFQK